MKARQVLSTFLIAAIAVFATTLFPPKSVKATYNPGWNSATGQVLINPTQGKTIMICGTSITVSGNKWVDNITGFGAANIYNYATSGTRWINFGGSTTRQQSGDQVQAAINAGITPDIIIFDIGTNDLGSATSTVATALAKDTSTLDKTKCIEAQRWDYLKCQIQWPSAKIFLLTPLQRKDVDVLSSTYAQFRSDEISLANYMNVIVIDQSTQAGFNMDFEVWSSAGRLMLDGLHPNATGAVIQAKFIMTQVQNYMPQ